MAGICLSHESCSSSKHGVFEVVQFNGVIEIHHSPTLVAMETKT